MVFVGDASYEQVAGRLSAEAKSLLIEMAEAHLEAGSGDRMFIESNTSAGRMLILSMRGFRRNIIDVDGTALNDLAQYGFLQTEHSGRGSRGFRVGSDGLDFYRYLTGERESAAPATTATLAPGENARLEVVIRLIRETVESPAVDHLDRDELAELQSELATLEAQHHSPKPKRAIVRESLSTVRSIVEGVAGNATFQAVVGLLADL